jgi:DNA-binding response OmpR family regulator
VRKSQHKNPRFLNDGREEASHHDVVAPARAHGIAAVMKLLVVEDSLDVAERLCLLLRGAKGIEIDRAGSLREGIDRLRRFPPDTLVLDLRLPDGNGMELMRLCKHDYPATRIMMLTNHTHYKD